MLPKRDSNWYNVFYMNQWNKIYKGEGEKFKYYDINKPHEDLSEVTKFFKKNNVEKILDLGCGAGRNLIPLLQSGFEVSGLDLAPDGLKIIRKKAKQEKLKTDLKLGNIYDRLPYADNSFDAIISVQVLQHGTEKQILTAIEEIKRILKPGGVVFITLCGRLMNGKVRLFLVKTAKKIAPNTYVPTQGNEIGLTHFIYNKDRIRKHFKEFKMLKSWKDERDYYCFIAENKL